MWNKRWYSFRKRTEFNRMLKILYSEDQQRLVSMKNKNIKYIHILKNKLCAKFGLSDETYRALLQDNYSVNSSKDLSLIQQKELKDMMSAVSIRTGRAKVSISLLNHQVFSIKRKNTLSLKQENFIIFLSQGRPLEKNTITDVFAFCSKIIKKKLVLYKIYPNKKQKQFNIKKML